MDVSVRVGPPRGSDTNPPTVLRVTYARPTPTIRCRVFNLRNTELHFCFVTTVHQRWRGTDALVQLGQLTKVRLLFTVPKPSEAHFSPSRERALKKGGGEDKGQARVTRLERGFAPVKCTFTLGRLTASPPCVCALNYCRNAPAPFQCNVIQVHHHRLEREEAFLSLPHFDSHTVLLHPLLVCISWLDQTASSLMQLTRAHHGC